MKKHEFLTEISELLELNPENVEFGTRINLDSLAILSIIAFLDDKFQRKASASDLIKISTIGDIAAIVGVANID
jgi:acyl carrier protein